MMLILVLFGAGISCFINFLKPFKGPVKQQAFKIILLTALVLAVGITFTFFKPHLVN